MYVYTYYICVCILMLNTDTYTYISIVCQWKMHNKLEISAVFMWRRKRKEETLPTYCLVPFDVWTKCRVRDNRLGLFCW